MKITDRDKLCPCINLRVSLGQMVLIINTIIPKLGKITLILQTVGCVYLLLQVKDQKVLL